jgi:HSP20 family molecular chaperone IbpA
MDMHECWDDSNGAGPSRRVTATLEIPGMKKEALRLDVRDGQLVIEGDRFPPPHAHARHRSTRRQLSPRSRALLTGPGVPPPHESVVRSSMEESTCHAALSEIRYGRFRRVLTLPPGLDVSPLPALLIVVS